MKGLGMALPEIDDMKGFLGMLEHDRLKLVEEIMQKETYSEADLEKMALHGNAVTSVREAIAFREDFDSR